MTQDIYAQLREAVVAALRDVVPDLTDEVADRVELTSPRDPSHGDMATNAALLAAKPARQPPAKLALAIADRGYVLQRGRIVMQGSGPELRSRMSEIEDAYLSMATHR